MTTPDNPTEACPKCGAPEYWHSSVTRTYQCGTVENYYDNLTPRNTPACDYAATLRAQLAAAGIGEAEWRVEREDLLARIEAIQIEHDAHNAAATQYEKDIQDLRAKLEATDRPVDGTPGAPMTTPDTCPKCGAPYSHNYDGFMNFVCGSTYRLSTHSMMDSGRGCDHTATLKSKLEAAEAERDTARLVLREVGKERDVACRQLIDAQDERNAARAELAEAVELLRETSNTISATWAVKRDAFLAKHDAGKERGVEVMPDTLTREQLDELRRLEAEATPGEWGEDDCNVFSRPMADAREQAIVAKLRGEPFDAEAINLDAFVCTTGQRSEFSDVDAHLIAAMRNALRLLLDAADENERLRGEVERLREARPRAEWHEDDGSVLWWTFPIEEPPYCGGPDCNNWPDYHTHWTQIPVPKEPKE